MYADVDVKNAIANGEIPGPQMQLAGDDANGDVQAPWGIRGRYGFRRACSMWMVRRSAVRRCENQ